MDGVSTPPPGGWQPYQPGQPPQGGVPPYGPPPGNYPQAGQTGFQQGGWPQPPQAPRGGNTTKFLLIAIAVLLVIGVTVGATLLFTRNTDDAVAAPPSSNNSSSPASAGDVGPVAIITDDPTCKTYVPINDSLAQAQTQGWSDQRSTLGASSTWTPEQRAVMQSVATAMTNSSVQLEKLAAETPHRVMRELYTQYIAYSSAYANSFATYVPSDNILATVTVAIGSSLASICTALDNGASGRTITLAPALPPTSVAPIDDTTDPARFLTSVNNVCSGWVSREGRLGQDLASWSQLGTALAPSQWTPEQRATQQSAANSLRAYADQIASDAKQSGNATIEDFGALAALYLKAYSSVGDTYTSADSWLSTAGLRLGNIVTDACRAVDA